MWEKMDAFVGKYHMLQDGDTILVGLSGGADSVCLFRYLLAVQKKISVKIYALHVNHLLRGEEAERDERFVEALCRDWNVPFQAVKKNVMEEKTRRNCSVEEAGRLVRYACFDLFAEKWGCNKIAVAHHKNDLAETVLFRMARGTGFRGLAGIRPVTGNIIRPLLCMEKEEICSILYDLKQNYVEDGTNQNEEYSRNFIRLRLVPEMKQINSGAIEHLAKLSQQAAALMDYLEPVFQEIYEKNVIWRGDSCLLPEAKIGEMHPVELYEIVRRMLAAMAGRQKDLSAVHVEQLAGLVEKREGKYQEFPYGLVAERTREGILLLRREKYLQSKKKKTGKPVGIQWIDKNKLEIDGIWETGISGRGNICFYLKEFHGDDIEKNDCVKYFDYDKIKSTLCLRSRKAGDYFIMDKEGRHKTLKRYFIDEKIPSEERDERILLAEDAHILWALGGRISEAYRVEPGTRRVLVVQAEDKIFKK